MSITLTISIIGLIVGLLLLALSSVLLFNRNDKSIWIWIAFLIGIILFIGSLIWMIWHLFRKEPDIKTKLTNCQVPELIVKDKTITVTDPCKEKTKTQYKCETTCTPLPSRSCYTPEPICVKIPDIIVQPNTLCIETPHTDCIQQPQQHILYETAPGYLQYGGQRVPFNVYDMADQSYGTQPPSIPQPLQRPTSPTSATKLPTRYSTPSTQNIQKYPPNLLQDKTGLGGRTQGPAPPAPQGLRFDERFANANIPVTNIQNRPNIIRNVGRNVNVGATPQVRGVNRPPPTLKIGRAVGPPVSPATTIAVAK